MLVEGLAALLATNNGVKQYLIPGGVSRTDKTTGVFPGFAPKEVSVPYIVYAQASGDQDRTMQGSSALQQASFQLELYAASYYTAKKLAQAVKALLAGYTGTLTDTDQTTVEGIWLTHEGDIFEEIPHGILYGVALTHDVLFLDPSTSTGGNTP
jgi:Protein of unknown function (DUF3168)